MLACVFYHPLINPIVNPAAEILPVNEIPKIVMVMKLLFAAPDKEGERRIKRMSINTKDEYQIFSSSMCIFIVSQVSQYRSNVKSLCVNIWFYIKYIHISIAKCSIFKIYCLLCCYCYHVFFYSYCHYRCRIVILLMCRRHV